MTIPHSPAEYNHQGTGSYASVDINGSELKVKPGRQRPKLSELLAATPVGTDRVAGWDEMPAVGAEL